jgi:4-hydroxy-2-oxovalerate/4-hydroxy-2-oxohexanoate aldolase
MTLQGKKVTVHDMTLRDGMHPKRHQMSLDQMKAVACGLDAAGVPLIEVTHGDGLGGSSLNYGFPAHSDEEYLSTVIPLMKQAKISALLLPGIGTVDHLKMAQELGVSTIRVATHCTEADIANEHIETARHMGFDVATFLMMAHKTTTENLVKQAKIMEAAGAHCVYVVDSAGALLMSDTREKVDAFKQALSCQVGFHNHDNLGLGVANTIVAIEAGADRVDGSVAGMGAGAGNCRLEVLVAVLNRMGIPTNAKLYPLIDCADQLVRPLQKDRPVQIDGNALMMGYAGVYSSFLLHTERAAARFGVDARDILVEVGRRGLVGGQEDLIADVALDLAGK